MHISKLNDCRFEAVWQTSSLAINFKDRRGSFDLHGKDSFAIIHLDTPHGSNDNFCARSGLRSKKWNHRIVNLVAVVHWARDCCESNTKLWIPKKVVFFVIMLILVLHFTLCIYIYIYIIHELILWIRPHVETCFCFN